MTITLEVPISGARQAITKVILILWGNSFHVRNFKKLNIIAVEDHFS